MGSPADRLRVTSPSFRHEWLDAIRRDAAPFHPDGHYLYPADEQGNHLQGFFLLEPVAERKELVARITEDAAAWARREGVSCDLLFAPAQPAVKVLGDALAERLGVPTAYWEYRPTGRFGDRLVQGRVGRGARALVFNGVSHTGRCVGLRLPEFVRREGGTTVAAAVFVKGVAPKVADTERDLGSRFYSTLQADVPVYSPRECPLCKSAGPPVPWTALLAGSRP